MQHRANGQLEKCVVGRSRKLGRALLLLIVPGSCGDAHRLPLHSEQVTNELQRRQKLYGFCLMLLHCVFTKLTKYQSLGGREHLHGHMVPIKGVYPRRGLDVFHSL